MSQQQAMQEQEQMVADALYHLYMQMPSNANLEDWKTVVAFCGMTHHFKTIFNPPEAA